MSTNLQFDLSRCAWALLALALLVLWFANLDARHLIKSDEGRYAEIAREMVTSGDWLTPRLNDFKYFYKPPLQYWATAAFYTAFGVHEWTARLWTALTGLATVLFTAFFAGRLFGRATGIAAGLICGSCLMVVFMAHLLTLDMAVACFMTIALGALALALVDRTAAGRRRWLLACWAALALGVLSKGLMAVVLPAAVLAIYVVWQRDWALLRRLEWARGAALFLALAAPWFVAVSIANPEFPRFFFYGEHIERFLTRTHGRYQPWWWFVPILVAGLLPWSLLLPQALREGWRAEVDRPFQPRRLLLVWAVFIFVFFSASSSKLASYLLPIVPALAVLVALALQHVSQRLLRWSLLPVAVLAAAGAAFAPFGVRWGNVDTPADLIAAFVPWVVVALVLALIGVVAAVLLDARGRRGLATLALSCCALGGWQLALTGHDALSPSMSSAHLAQRIRPWLEPDLPFYSIRFYDHTLNFYLNRNVTMVEMETEMAFGIAQEPHKYVPSLAQFERLWQTHPRALAITSDHEFERIAASGLPLVVIARDTRRVVFRKP